MLIAMRMIVKTCSDERRSLSGDEARQAVGQGKRTSWRNGADPIGCAKRVAWERLVVQVPAAHFLPAVDDAAEEFGGFLGVVARRVRFASVEVDAGGLAGFGQYGLPVGEPGQGGGVEAGERMERVALDAGAQHGGIQEAQDRKST